MSDYTAIELPPALADRLQEIHRLPKRPATLGEYVAAASATRGDRRIDPAALCSGDDSRHEVTIEGETSYTHCVLDTLILAALRAAPATVRSTSPVSGEVVTLELGPDDGPTGRAKPIELLTAAIDGLLEKGLLVLLDPVANGRDLVAGAQQIAYASEDAERIVALAHFMTSFRNRLASRRPYPPPDRSDIDVYAPQTRLDLDDVVWRTAHHVVTGSCRQRRQACELRG